MYENDLAVERGASRPRVTAEATPLVGVIMGSDSDLRVMQDALDTLDEFGVPREVHIVSAHRTPDWMFEYARERRRRAACA